MDRKESGDSNFWSFLFSGLFSILLVGFAIFLYSRGVEFDAKMGFFEFFVISLAVFRLTRLLVYDSIALWIRDLFFEIKKEWNEKEAVFVVKRSLAKSGIRRKLGELLLCPWCVGTWVALFVLFGYYLHPISWWFILGVAIAGVSTVIQILANLIGWNAEGSKNSVNSLKVEQEGMI